MPDIAQSLACRRSDRDIRRWPFSPFFDRNGPGQVISPYAQMASAHCQRQDTARAACRLEGIRTPERDSRKEKPARRANTNKKWPKHISTILVPHQSSNCLHQPPCDVLTCSGFSACRYAACGTGSLTASTTFSVFISSTTSLATRSTTIASRIL